MTSSESTIQETGDSQVSILKIINRDVNQELAVIKRSGSRQKLEILESRTKSFFVRRNLPHYGIFASS